MCVCVHSIYRHAGGQPSQQGHIGRLGKVDSVGVDEGYRAKLQRRIIVSSCHVSCGYEEAKTAAVYPPSPPSSSPPSALPPNIKGSLWHGFSWAGWSAGDAALQAIHCLMLCEHPTVKPGKPQTLFFILLSLSSIRHSDSPTHPSMSLVLQWSGRHRLCNSLWPASLAVPSEKRGGRKILLWQMFPQTFL